MRYRFDLVCPRCGKLAETVAENYTLAPRVLCEDCVKERFRVINMKVVAFRRLEDA
jgi:hypothetical protein